MERPQKLGKDSLPYIEYLESQLNKFTRSPYYNTYITISNQIDSFNKQLTIDETKTVTRIIGETEDGKSITADYTSGMIDLFADKDSKEFDRAWKYLLESVDLNKKLDELRKMLTPEETKKAGELLKTQSLGMAEKLALKNLNKNE